MTTRSAVPPDQEWVSLEDFFGLLVRHWLLIMVVTVLGVVLGVVIALSIPKRYESIASVFVFNALDPGLASLAAEFGFGGSTGTDYRGYVVALLSSNEVRYQTVENNKLLSKQEFWVGTALEEDPSLRTLSAAVLRLRNLVAIESKEETEPVTIRATTMDPELSKLLAKSYLDFAVNRLTKEATSQETYLAQQINAQRKKVSNAHARLREFQESSGVVTSLEAQGPVEFSALIDLQKQLALVETELLGVTKQLSGPGDLMSQIGLTSRQMGLSAQADGLRQLLDEQQNRVTQFPEYGAKYAELVSHVTFAESQLTLLLRKYELTRFQNGQNAPFKIVDAPDRPAEEANQNLLKAACVVVAALSAFATALFIAARRDRTRAPAARVITQNS